MSQVQRSPVIAPLLLLATVLWVVFWFSHALGYWEDDAYIHLEYARSVAQGRGFMFNGLLSNGDTSPAWVLVLAAGLSITSSWLVAGKALTVLCVGFTLWMTWRFTVRLENDWGHHSSSGTQAPWVLLLFVLSPFFCYWAFSGMEAVGAAGWLMLVSMLLVPTRASVATFMGAAFLIGLGPLVRPEFTLMFAAGGLFLLGQWHGLTKSMAPAHRWALFVVAALLLCAPLAAWVVYAMDVFGYVMPNTNAAKRAAPSDFVLVRLAQVFGLGYPGVLLVLGVLGLGAVWPGARNATQQPKGGRYLLPMVAWPALLWVLVTLVFYVVNHTYVQTRYATVMAPALMCVGWVAMARWIKPWAWHVATSLTLVLSLLASTLLAYPHVRNKVEGSQNLNKLAAYINTLPPDSKVAVYSIGQLGFASERELIDIGGITRPEASKYLFVGGDAMLKWARSEGATHYISGEPPEPGATLLLEIPTREGGWGLNTKQYDRVKYMRVWQLPAN